jgi:hypothetical protein
VADETFETLANFRDVEQLSIGLDGSGKWLDTVDFELNKYSVRVAERLFRMHPEWQRFARAENSDTGKYLVVEIPEPSVGRPHLVIYTEGDEITVCYDQWHAHFDCWFDNRDDQDFSNAIGCVHDILSEAMAVAVRMRGDNGRGRRLLNEAKSRRLESPGRLCTFARGSALETQSTQPRSDEARVPVHWL